MDDKADKKHGNRQKIRGPNTFQKKKKKLKYILKKNDAISKM